MKITGLAKGLFEKWYLLLIRQERKDYDKFSDDQVLRKFYRLLLSQQWGVYQDWADSLGYELYISKESPVEYFWAVSDLIRSFYEGNCKTRKEARNAAIEKLNELVNGV